MATVAASVNIGGRTVEIQMEESLLNARGGLQMIRLDGDVEPHQVLVDFVEEYHVVGRHGYCKRNPGYEFPEED